MKENTLLYARWYVDSESGYEYLIDCKTQEILAKRGKDKKLLPLDR